jgi:hypothetical protein
LRPPLQELFWRREEYAGIEGGMRGKESGGSREHGLGYVLIPEQLLNQMGTISDEALRVVLYLHVAQKRAGVVGVPVPLGELAEHCGLNLGRARLGLSHLSKMRWVESIPDTDCWRLLPPTLVG